MTDKCKKCEEMSRNNKIAYLIVLLLIGILIVFYFNKIEVKDEKNGELRKIIEKFDNGSGEFEYNGKSYSFKENNQALNAKIYIGKNCKECANNAKIIQKFLKEHISNLGEVKTITNSKYKQSEVAYPLSIVFSKEIKDTEFYKKNKKFFYKTDDGYGFYAHALDINIESFNKTPSSELVGIESEKAKNSLVLFVSPDCPECNTMNNVMTVLEKKYGKKIRTSYIITADEQSKLNKIVKGIYCAKEQDKGMIYLNKILSNQKSWKNNTNIYKVLSNYNTSLGLNNSKYNVCMHSKKAVGFLNLQENEFAKFGVTKVPTLFINNKKFEGVQTVLDIEKELKK